MEQLQMVPEQCVERYEPLKQLLLPNRNTTSITYEYVTGNDGPADDEVPTLEWWEEEFLPTVASAFSCGYTSADDDNINPRFLPRDICDAFPNIITIRQVWRLVKGYIRSNQKQREGADRQQDFDGPLYVPFLPPKHVPSSRVYIGKKDRPDGTSGLNLRGGYPTYQGPAIWYLWHSFASRLTELERSCIVAHW
jgi:Zn ribbon nucleic-acid-binding protein